MVPSTSYKDGQFLLLLDNPVMGGSYTCRVPPSSASATCPHGNNDSHSGEATVAVDSSELRLLAVEARQAGLVAENEELKERLGRLEANCTDDVFVSQQNSSDLYQQVQDLGQQLNQLKSQGERERERDFVCFIA